MKEFPYLIAEIGVNHEGNLQTALDMIDQVADAGWNAAKFQSYSAELLASKDFSHAYWDLTQEPEESQYKLFSKFKSFSLDDYEKLIARCKVRGIDFLTTAFDDAALVHFQTKMPYIKIASADITNVPLIRLAASSGRPLIISCGAASLEEIRSAIEIANLAGNDEISLLHCVLNYPTETKNAQLQGILELKAEFPSYTIGYSDHTKYEPSSDIQPCVMAFIMGARIIEKHFTHDRSLQGNDHYHAADFDGLVTIRRHVLLALELLGSGLNQSLLTQEHSRAQARRRIFAKRPIPENAAIRAEDLIPLRGQEGIEIQHWDEVLTKRSAVKIEAEAPIVWSDLKELD